MCMRAVRSPKQVPDPVQPWLQDQMARDDHPVHLAFRKSPYATTFLALWRSDRETGTHFSGSIRALAREQPIEQSIADTNYGASRFRSAATWGTTQKKETAKWRRSNPHSLDDTLISGVIATIHLQ